MDEQAAFRTSLSSDLELRESSGRIRAECCQLRFTGRHEGLNRLREWIAKNDPRSLTLRQAADIACLEPHHFSKIFRKHVGEGFKEWRCRVRIIWAVRAIEQGMHSLADVVHLSGYRDRRAFERAVKRLTGRTPGRFQRRAEDSGSAHPSPEAEAQLKPQATQLKPQLVRAFRETIADMGFEASPEGERVSSALAGGMDRDSGT